MKVICTIDPVLSRYAAKIAALGDGEAHRIMSTSLTWGGDKLRNLMAQAEAAQTNLPMKTLDAALDGGMMLGSLTYLVRSRGGNVRLKYFGAREEGDGVSAAPWGFRKIYSGSFMMAGRAGARRMVPSWNGQVLRRVDPTNKRWRLPGKGWKESKASKTEATRSGLFIPTEMLKGRTLATFERAAPRLQGEILSKIATALDATGPS